jgi:hypothetical protein
VCRASSAAFALLSPFHVGLRRNTSPRSLFNLAVTRWLRIDRVAVFGVQQKVRIAIANQTKSELEFVLPQHSFIEGCDAGQVIMITKTSVVDRIPGFGKKEIVVEWFALQEDAGRTLAGRVTAFFSDAASEAFQSQEKVWKTLVPRAASREWSGEHDEAFFRGLVAAQVNGEEASCGISTFR